MWPGLPYNVVAGFPEQGEREREREREREGMSPFMSRPQKLHSINTLAFYSLGCHKVLPRSKGRQLKTSAAMRNGKGREPMGQGMHDGCLKKDSATVTI